MVIATQFHKLQTVKIFVRTLWKPLFPSPLWLSTFESVSMRALLSCVFIILIEVDLENVSPTIIWNLLVFLNKLTAEAKYSIENWENLPLPVEMQLS